VAFLARLNVHYTNNLKLEVLKIDIATTEKSPKCVYNLATELLLSITGGGITVPPLTRSKKFYLFSFYFQFSFKD